MMHYTNTDNPIDFPQTVDPMRHAFETITYSSLNIAGSPTAHGLRRKLNGEYVSDLLEDHWNTFQEGWEAAIDHLKNKTNDSYSDIVSDGGMDPR
jgi:hypothetical protein